MPISNSLKTTLLTVTDAQEIIDIQLIQGVWGGYGELFRVRLSGGNTSSVVVKLVKTPQPGLTSENYTLIKLSHTGTCITPICVMSNAIYPAV